MHNTTVAREQHDKKKRCADKAPMFDSIKKEEGKITHVEGA